MDNFNFCFVETINPTQVRSSLNFLLLPSDKLQFDDNKECIQISTSPDRAKLFEKFLSGRYTLKRSNKDLNSGLIHDHLTCALLFKTIPMKSKPIVMELDLDDGKSGELEADAEKIKVTCAVLSEKSVNLELSTKTEPLRLVKGEWLDITTDLIKSNDKNETHYELQLK
jgi:inosine-uridine nucleoside N-ribohydrolase